MIAHLSRLPLKSFRVKHPGNILTREVWKLRAYTKLKCEISSNESDNILRAGRAIKSPSPPPTNVYQRFVSI